MDRINLDPRRAIVRGEGFTKRVERAGADIAKHHADRANRQSNQSAFRSVAVGRLLFGGLIRLCGIAPVVVTH